MRQIVCAEEYFNKLKERGVVLFGGGSKARQAIDILRNKGIKIIAVCDSNEKLWGTEICQGLMIRNFEEIKKEYEGFIVLLTVAVNNALSICKTLDTTIEYYQFCSPFKVEKGLLEDYEVEKNQNKIQTILECLEDEMSKDIFIENLNYKLSGNMFPLIEMITEKNPLLTYFDDDLFTSDMQHIYVDIGAYTGDSITSFLMATRGSYERIIAYEGDEGNYNALEHFKAYVRVPNLDIRNTILWSEREEQEIYTFSDNSDINYDSPNLYIGVENIADNITLQKVKNIQLKSQKVKVYSDTLDNQFIDGEGPSVMKINAMAADFAILKGGRKLIENYKPMLILEYGVKKDDLFTMILWLKKINPQYKFYLREKRIYKDIKTILYVK